MPVIKSAIKKLRRDRKREKENDLIRSNLERAIKTAKKQKTAALINKAVSLVDRAVKKNLLHANKAARVKFSLSKLAKPSSKTTKPAVKSVSKPTSKTAAKKPLKPAKTKKK